MADEAILLDVLPDESLRNFIKRWWNRDTPYTGWAFECFSREHKGIILTKDSTGHDYIYGWEDTRELTSSTRIINYSETLKALYIQRIGEL